MSYQNASVGLAAGYPKQDYTGQAQDCGNSVRPPSRFTLVAGRLETQLGHLAGLTERSCRIADRLGGSVPEPVTKAGAIRGNGGCLAGIIEGHLDDLGALCDRLHQIVERLENL